MTENVCAAANFELNYYITLFALIKQQEDDTKLDLVCSITEIKSKAKISPMAGIKSKAHFSTPYEQKNYLSTSIKFTIL